MTMDINGHRYRHRAASMLSLLLFSLVILACQSNLFGNRASVHANYHRRHRYSAIAATTPTRSTLLIRGGSTANTPALVVNNQQEKIEIKTYSSSSRSSFSSNNKSTSNLRATDSETRYTTVGVLSLDHADKTDTRKTSAIDVGSKTVLLQQSPLHTKSEMVLATLLMSLIFDANHDEATPTTSSSNNNIDGDSTAPICALHRIMGYFDAVHEDMLEITGILGTVSKDYSDHDSSATLARTSVAAECIGCTCDLIVLTLLSSVVPPPTQNIAESSENVSTADDKPGLSEERAKAIQNLFLGIQRKLRSGSDNDTTTILVLLPDLETEKIMKNILESERLRLKIDANSCRFIFTDSTEKTDLYNVLLDLASDYHTHSEKYVPLGLFPKLVQSMSNALTVSGRQVDECFLFNQDIQTWLNMTAYHVDTVTNTDDPGDTIPSTDLITIENLQIDVLSDVEVQLSKLESKQEGVSLSGGIPILEFGAESEAILQKVTRRFDDLLTSIDATEPYYKSVVKQVEETRKHILHQIVYGSVSSPLQQNIHTMFQNQLSALREYYGRKYEAILDDSADPNDDETTIAAAECTEAFKTAAIHATPSICRLGNELYQGGDNGLLSYEYVTELNGLLTDMMAGLEQREGMTRDWENAAADNADDDDEEEHAGDNAKIKKKKKMTWYQKLGARALVLGVNYAQGWLALQGLKRAAAERDRNMPKFPLF